MRRVIVIGAVSAIAGLAATLPSLAEALVWPWKDKTPPDPALVILTSVESVTAAINKLDPPTVTINVGATTATPGFTELQLAPRIGNPEDLVFAFDAKGRPPQDMTVQVTTSVTFSVEYKDAPIDKVGVIEVYGQSNCKAFSIADNKAVECSSKSVSQ
jgi:hypothetical protein